MGRDHRDDGLDEEFAAERAVGRESGQDRARIRQPAGLDHDAAEMRNDAALAVDHHAVQRHLQVGAEIAAQAAVAEQHGLLAAVAQQRIVDAGLAELVDQDGGAAALRRLQKMLHQRGLAGAEKSGDDGHRNPRAALALEPAPEAPRGR